jgi:Cu-Zn family superoxide dismutase
MPRTTPALTLVAALILSVPNALAADASTTLVDTDGASVGTVELQATPNGTLLRVDLHAMPSGVHAFHIHEIGRCEPDFGHAGGHYNPEGVGHGFLDAGGYHVGDMPNLHIPDSGELTIEILNHQLQLDERLFDEDGASIMIHAGADDYTSDPAGAAGARIACGVIAELE